MAGVEDVGEASQNLGHGSGEHHVPCREEQRYRNRGQLQFFWSWRRAKLQLYSGWKTHGSLGEIRVSGAFQIEG